MLRTLFRSSNEPEGQSSTGKPVGIYLETLVSKMHGQVGDEQHVGLQAVVGNETLVASVINDETENVAPKPCHSEQEEGNPM